MLDDSRWEPKVGWPCSKPEGPAFLPIYATWKQNGELGLVTASAAQVKKVQESSRENDTFVRDPLNQRYDIIYIK